MSNVKTNIFDLSVTATGLTYSLYYIKEVLGVIILILTIANILYKAVIAIVNHFKNKDLEAVAKDIDEAKEDLEEIKDNIKEDNWHEYCWKVY